MVAQTGTTSAVKVHDPGKDPSPIIRVRDMTKIFHNRHEVTAVNHVSLDVDQGEIFGLLGPNGAGKSTLIRILTTLMRPSSGTACIGQYLVGKDDEEIRKIIGVCPQNSTIDLDLTAYENLEFYGNLLNVDEETLPDRIHYLLGMVKLTDHTHVPVKNFSGGMRRKLEIVRAFLHHPLILFLDEPTIGLDPDSRREIWDQIKRLNAERTTIILTTHYMDEAEKLCDRIAFMNGGRLVALDTPENLKKVIPSGELIELGSPALDPAVVSLLQHRDGVRSVEIHDHVLRISVKDSSRVLPVILADLEHHSVRVQSITIRQPSLEDVFIYLTGIGLEGG
ncbi:MAG: ATP-binding cassette domain-containing protein [Methanolinea sp.]|nr:ATP-binding cassette domain-containing protein [Methanolinea sp.]